MPEEDATQPQPAPADSHDNAETDAPPQMSIDDPFLRHAAAKLDLEIGADTEVEQSEQRLRALRQAQQMPTDDDA